MDKYLHLAFASFFSFILIRIVISQQSVCRELDSTYCRTYAVQGACGCEALGGIYADMCQPFLSACPITCNLCEQQNSTDVTKMMSSTSVPNDATNEIMQTDVTKMISSSTVRNDATDNGMLQNVRLVSGLSSLEGRVEVLLNGIWGTVCDNNWDYNDARVVCRSLGFSGALGTTSLSEFGPSFGPMHLNDFQCEGSESNILDCLSNAEEHQPCSSPYNQAGVRCLECKDVNPKCSQWAKEGGCESYPGEIRPICHYSCNQCEIRGMNVTALSTPDADTCVTGQCFLNSNNETQCIPGVDICLTVGWYQGLICLPTPTQKIDSIARCMKFDEHGKSNLPIDDILDRLNSSIIVLGFGDQVNKQIEDALNRSRSVLSLLEQYDLTLQPQHITDRQKAVTVLFLWYMDLYHIEDNAFTGLISLRTLILGENKLQRINKAAFSGLAELQYLNFRYNKIHYIENGTFSDMKTLVFLELTGNKLTDLQPGIFNGLQNLRNLDLKSNKLQTIEVGIFDDLQNLRFLYMEHNDISFISPGAFSALENLRILNLSSNSLQYLQEGVFSGLVSLEYLDLNNNTLSYIDAFTFASLRSLRFLFLLDLDLKAIDSDVFSGLSSVEKLATSDNRLCCLLDNNVNFTCAKTSVSGPLDTCSRLFPSWALRIAGWVMGLSALVGNGIVLCVRTHDKNMQSSKVQNIMIGSLAMADILMGLYMIIITSADVHYGDDFYLSAPQWRSSSVCRFAGFVGFLSSEASVFTLTLITIDRFICIMFPFGRFRIGSRASKILVGTVWIFTILLSMGLVIITSYRPDVYGLSDVCLGLPLHVETESTGRLDISGLYFFEYQVNYVITNSSSKPTWLFSIAVFIGVNLVSFAFILVCYIMIFIKTSRSSARVRNNASCNQSKEKKLAVRMALIVSTDLACWMPVIIMGILSQTGAVTLDPSLYAWTVILIVPINSSINPFLYTFIMYIDDRKKKNKNKTGGVNLKEVGKSKNTYSDDLKISQETS